MFIKKSRNFGFTLAELLISLAILAVLATFAIPKILSSQQDTERKAILKESIATISEVFYTGILRAELTETNFSTYFFNHINSVKTCNNSRDEGCWNTGLHCPNWADTWPGLIMHNGTHITQLDDADQSGGWDAFMLDYNGDAGPNQEGEDIICLRAQFSEEAGYRAGLITAWPSRPLSVAMFKEIFSR